MFTSVGVLAVVALGVGIGLSRAGNLSASPMPAYASLVGDFTCITSTDGSCAVAPGLNATPDQLTVEAWAQDGTADAKVPVVATNVGAYGFVLRASGPDGAPVERRRIHGSYVAWFHCASNAGPPCKHRRGGGHTAGGTATALPTEQATDPATTPDGATTSPVPGPTSTTLPSSVPTAPAGVPQPTQSTPAVVHTAPTVTTAPATTKPAPANGAALQWADEFDGAAGTGVNKADWTAVSGSHHGELECYSPKSSNVAMDGQGDLVLTSRREAGCDGMPYTSGRLEGLNKRTFKYGYFEVRAKLPTDAGAFPAFWMLGANVSEVGWPRSGEIDVVEITSNLPDSVHTNIHGVDTSGKQWQSGWGAAGTYKSQGDVGDGFHTYGLNWTSDTLEFYFDGKLIHTINRSSVPVWLWDQDNFLLLNLAIVNTNGPDTQTMDVDYVRVYSDKP
jgi:beta-glucanase (GH16 family)